MRDNSELLLHYECITFFLQKAYIRNGLCIVLMVRNHDLEDERDKASADAEIGLDTTIKELIEAAGYRSWKSWKRKKSAIKEGLLPYGSYLTLKKIGEYVDTIGDLKKLSETAGGFARLKHGVRFKDGKDFDEEKILPYRVLQSFGKEKLGYVNDILAIYGIEPIPWVSKKYKPGEMQKERGMEIDGTYVIKI